MRLPHRLKLHPIPDDIRDCIDIEQDVTFLNPVLMEPLSRDTHQSVFSTLLYCEELQMERNIRNYDMFGVSRGGVSRGGEGWLYTCIGWVYGTHACTCLIIIIDDCMLLLFDYYYLCQNGFSIAGIFENFRVLNIRRFKISDTRPRVIVLHICTSELHTYT